jgi:ribosomal protein L11 methyltransferase
MAWEQYVIETAPMELDAIEQVLFDCGAVAVSLEDAGDSPILEPKPGQTPLWPRMRIRALFEAGFEIATVQARLRSILPAGVVSSIESVADDDWTRAWLAHARPQWFGRRLCVTPAELAPSEQDAGDAVIVQLEPGLAFGTGSHPSTAGCLEWLAETDVREARVMDYGCGSGVLAIAACKLGARRATAVDIDPQARVSCRTNAQRNGCGSRVSVLAPARMAACAYDVLIANILAQPLIGLAPVFAALVRPGGTLVLAGMLADQVEAVAEAYRWSFEFEAPRHRDTWGLLIGRRNTASP